MNKSTFHVVAFATFLAISLAAHAQSKQLYTWTDENGVVHYVDTPPDNPDAVIMDAPEAYRPGSAGAYPEADATVVADEEDPELVESYADQKREQMAQDREKHQAEQAERAGICATARQRLDQIEPSRRVFYTDDQGETVRMDDEERVRLVQEAQTLVEQNCD